MDHAKALNARRWVEVLLAAGLVAWRLSRTVIDYGPWADWVLVAGVLWLLHALWDAAGEARERLGLAGGWRDRIPSALLVIAAAYLMVVYGYFQLGSTVRFPWMILDGWW